MPPAPSLPSDTPSPRLREISEGDSLNPAVLRRGSAPPAGAEFSVLSVLSVNISSVLRLKSPRERLLSEADCASLPRETVKSVPREEVKSVPRDKSRRSVPAASSLRNAPAESSLRKKSSPRTFSRRSTLSASLSDEPKSASSSLRESARGAGNCSAGVSTAGCSGDGSSSPKFSESSGRSSCSVSGAPKSISSKLSSVLSEPKESPAPYDAPSSARGA